jgi:hypothetical protein
MVGDVGHGRDSVWTLKADLLSARLLVWIASVGRDADLTADAHAYFHDRYSRLARCLRRRGRLRAAREAEANARRHRPPDGPPHAAAMAMPRPARWVRTWAVADSHDPDDAA